MVAGVFQPPAVVDGVAAHIDPAGTVGELCCRSCTQSASINGSGRGSRGCGRGVADGWFDFVVQTLCHRLAAGAIEPAQRESESGMGAYRVVSHGVGRIRALRTASRV